MLSVSENEWNINSEFVAVNAIVPSPNTWGLNNALHAGKHIFFLLDKCKDMSDNKGKGFFTEMLKPELHEIRRVLGAYTDETPINGVDEANACGVGYSIDNEWGLVLKVNTGESTRLIKIDRWD